MARHQKAPRDPNGRHIRIYCNLLDSPAYRVLSWSSRALFIDLRASLKGTNNGNISAALSDLKHRGWRSAATLANALFELQALGFIAKTRGGGIEHGSKVCSLYRFTDVEVFEIPKLAIEATKATHDYALIESVADAKRTLVEAQRRRSELAKATTEIRRKRSAEKKSTLQKLKRTDSEIEAVKHFSDSEIEAVTPAPLQKLKQTKGGVNGLQSQQLHAIEQNASAGNSGALTASVSEHLYMLPSHAANTSPKNEGRERARVCADDRIDQAPEVMQ